MGLPGPACFRATSAGTFISKRRISVIGASFRSFTQLEQPIDLLFDRTQPAKNAMAVICMVRVYVTSARYASTKVRPKILSFVLSYSIDNPELAVLALARQVKTPAK